MTNIETLKLEMHIALTDVTATDIRKCIDYLHSRGYLGGVWQPIETAPKDGGVFLICLPRMMNLIIRARFDRVHRQWLSERVTGDSISNVEFFHPGDLWMPLPAAPKGETK